MADTGNPWALRYPLLTDPPNGPVATQDLARQTHEALGHAYPCTSTTRPASQPGLIIYETDTDLLWYGDGTTWVRLQSGGDDTGWIDAVDAGWTPSGAFTFSNARVRRKWGMVGMYITMVSTNAFAAGDYTNTQCAQAPAGWIPTQANGGLNGGSNGLYHAAYVDAAGALVLTAGGGIAAGGTFNLTGTYML